MSLSEILESLRNARISSRDTQSLMHEYDMMFLGDNASTITSVELRHSMNKYFHVAISLEDLHKQLPVVCASLGMSFEAMKALDDLDNPEPACYMITLL